jgi:trehalose synthase
MPPLQFVDITPLPPERFEPIIEEHWSEFREAIAQGKELFDGRVVWNVNSTGKGGGVAEMLRSLIAYTRGAGIDARWVVIEGNPDFFKVTKRIHNNLHGVEGDGGSLGEAEAQIYEATLAPNADELGDLVSDRDVVILHDPQTAGLGHALKAKGATVIWRCHVGLDTPNDIARNAWRFLHPWVEVADAYVFSREAFAWKDLDRNKIAIIHPSIDAFSPKNQDMARETVEAILDVTGLMPSDSTAPATFMRVNGREEAVVNKTDLLGTGPIPTDAKVVVQVSRWDRLKDPIGVMRGCAKHAGPWEAHLVLAGPSVAEVADDPEGAEVLEESLKAWADLPADVRPHVHLACLPMVDGEENAAIVNALQRRADVVVQKSIAEGFGLTVAEAMWKARPVVATRIGGIQDQIVHETTGLLIDDPRDLQEFGRAVRRLLDDPELAERLGAAAHERVRDEFLGPRHLMQYLDLVAKLVGRAP